MYRTAFIYLGIAGLCGLFSLVYEANSHGVISGWMVWLFAWPLLGGALPYAMFARFLSKKSTLVSWVRMAHHGAVACATVGGCVTGVLQIYGTSSAWIDAYWVAAIILALTCVVGAIGATHRN